MMKPKTPQQPTKAEERIAEHIQQNPRLWEIAERCIRSTTTRTAAAREFVEIMRKGLGERKTPDGDRYTQQAIKAAMRTSNAVAGSNLRQFAEPMIKKGVTWRLH